MENKWEYDYSNLYSGNPQPQQEVPQQPPVAEAQPQPPVKKGGAGRVLLRLVSLVLAAAVCFGAGYGGALYALKQNPQSVVYQSTKVEPSTTLTAATGEVDLSAVASIITPSVVVITTEQLVNSGYSFWFGGQYVQSGAGSGVIMTEDGYIITNHHVVNGASNVTVTLKDDDTSYTATVVGSDSVNDIAVIKIDATGLTPAVMGDSDSLLVGETAIAVGNPLGTLGGTVTNGIISAVNRNINVEGQRMSLIQTNAAISPGNSGGGLFNARGELVGIVNAKSGSSTAEGLGFAIPVNTALQVATDLINSGYVTGRPVIGVSVLDVTDAQMAAQYGVSSLGVYIAEVVPGGAGERAGLKPGDRIISIEGKVVESKEDVVNEVQTHQVGDTVTMQVARDGQLMEFELVLQESQK